MKLVKYRKISNVVLHIKTHRFFKNINLRAASANKFSAKFRRNCVVVSGENSTSSYDSELRHQRKLSEESQVLLSPRSHRFFQCFTVTLAYFNLVSHKFCFFLVSLTDI